MIHARNSGSPERGVLAGAEHSIAPRSLESLPPSRSGAQGHEDAAARVLLPRFEQNSRTVQKTVLPPQRAASGVPPRHEAGRPDAFCLVINLFIARTRFQNTFNARLFLAHARPTLEKLGDRENAFRAHGRRGCLNGIGSRGLPLPGPEAVWVESGRLVSGSCWSRPPASRWAMLQVLPPQAPPPKAPARLIPRRRLQADHVGLRTVKATQRSLHLLLGGPNGAGDGKERAVLIKHTGRPPVPRWQCPPR